MSFLHECGETIVLYNAVEAERDPDRCLEHVVLAGLGICRALGDEDAAGLIGFEEAAEHGEGEGWR